MTTSSGITVSGISSVSDNAPTNGFLEVAVGTKPPQTNTTTTLTATLLRRFRTAGSPTPLQIGYFFYSTFGSNPPDFASGEIEVRVRRISGGSSYNQTQTVNINPTLPSQPEVVGVRGEGTLSFNGLSSNATYEIRIRIIYDSGSIGNSWNRTDTGLTISPHRFTFSGG